MKVTKQGVLLFSPDGSLYMTGWSFDAEGESFRDYAHMLQSARSEALNHIARSRGLMQPIELRERISLDAERQAAAAIAAARGAGKAAPAEPGRLHRAFRRLAQLVGA